MKSLPCYLNVTRLLNIDKNFAPISHSVPELKKYQKKLRQKPIKAKTENTSEYQKLQSLPVHFGKYLRIGVSKQIQI